MNHHPKCECDLCFAAECEAVAEAYRQIREGGPLVALPGWDLAEQAMREAVQYTEAAE